MLTGALFIIFSISLTSKVSYGQNAVTESIKILVDFNEHYAFGYSNIGRTPKGRKAINTLLQENKY